MGKTIEFNRNRSVIKEEDFWKIDKESIDAELEMRENFFDRIKELASQSLKVLPEKLDFEVDPESVRLLNEMFGYTDNYIMSYFAESKNAKYQMSLNIRIAQEEGDDYSIESSAILLKTENGKHYYFNHGESVWQTTDDFETLAQMIEEGGKECEVLCNLAGLLNCSPYMINATEGVRLLRKNKRIIEFEKSIEDIGDFLIVAKPNDMNIIGLEDMRVLLIPDDFFRYGSMVYADKDGFHLCQYIDDEDIFNMRDIVSDAFFAEELDQEYFVKEIYVTDDAKEMKKILYFMWDHYTNTDIFSFPLSDSARIEGTNPLDKMSTYTSPYGRELTKKEKENKEELVSFLELIRPEEIEDTD